MIGSWGLYEWLEEHGAERIHPDDIASFRELSPDCKVFECVGMTSSHILVRYGEKYFRVKPELFKPVKRPARRIGEKVKLLVYGDVVLTDVSDVIWDFKRSETFYLVAVKGKKSSKRYWSSDFDWE